MPEADGPVEWQADVSFSDRFALVSDIAEHLARTKSLQPAEARQQAQNSETAIFNAATSAAEYHARCNEHITSESSVEEQHPASDDEDEPALSPTPVTLGRFESANHHRDGLFSFVFKAKNPDVAHPEADPTKAFVAIKLTTPSTMVEPHDSLREARILDEARSDRVISILETFRISGGRFALVFPFMPFALDQLLRKRRLNQAQAKSHIRDLFSALTFLHQHDIIHRDVKPSNILLRSADGPAYLSDFGIAWSPRDEASEKPDDKITDVGTTCYRPPELLFGNRSYGTSLDLWAAGCTLAEVASLNNKTLFESGDIGTELALIQSIFQSLGTPDLDVWPEAATFSDWGKMQWKEYDGRSWSELLPNAPDDARHLVDQLVRFESGRRLKAADALKHEYLAL